jgi:hypothetical protein
MSGRFSMPGKDTDIYQFIMHIVLAILPKTE